MRTIKKQARIAGILYFLLGISAPWGLLYVPGKLIVSGNAVATADHLRASEGLLRFGIASELFHQVVVIFVVLALFRLFRGVNEMLSWQMVILGALVSVPIMFVNVLNEIAAMILARAPEFLSVIDKAERDALSYLFLRLHTNGIQVAAIFWGLWLFPFALLVIRSGFIPRFLGYLMMLAGIGYLVSSIDYLILTKHIPAVGQIAGILEFGEPPIMLWLLIWGARGPKANDPVA